MLVQAGLVPFEWGYAGPTEIGDGKTGKRRRLAEWRKRRASRVSGDKRDAFEEAVGQKIEAAARCIEPASAARLPSVQDLVNDGHTQAEAKKICFRLPRRLS